MATPDFHHEAIGRLCYICDQIILKNGHVIDENLTLNIAEMFSIKIELTNNVTPSNVCHTCWRTVKHFFKKKGSISIRLKNFQSGSCISMIVRHVSCITRTKKVLTVFNTLMLTVCKFNS